MSEVVWNILFLVSLGVLAVTFVVGMDRHPVPLAPIPAIVGRRVPAFLVALVVLVVVGRLAMADLGLVIVRPVIVVAAGVVVVVTLTDWAIRCFARR